jgi:multiple sugar transport system permease protein
MILESRKNIDAIRKAKLKHKEKKAAKIIWSVFRMFLFIGLGFVLMYPILYMISISFRPVSEVSDPSIVWIPKTLTLSNFYDVLKVMKFPDTLFTTLSISVGSAILQVISCSLAGYGLARFKLKEGGVLFAIVIFMIIVPMQTLTIPTYIGFKNFDFWGIGTLVKGITGVDIKINLLDSMMVYFLPSALGMGLKSGFFIFVFRQFFRGLPIELEEAALIDGCGAFKTFIKVMVPISATSFLTVFLFSLVWHWNEYYYSIMYMSSVKTLATSLATLSLSLKSIGVDIFNPFQLTTRLQSGCFIMIVPLLILYIILQKYFVEGVERSGITG